ncbi:hypothetical protein H8356DRAFT_1327013 [Neocallimastix lanati (nom. inval.)]|nr:hypothetical protein H8356DRAFT_1327013 [Neocallimastix sp. JGI-2020a]
MSQNEKDCVEYVYNLPCITFISEKLNYEKYKINLVRISISQCGNFSKDPTSKFNDITKEIVDAYNKCKNIAPLNWRVQKYIVKNFENFPNIFNMDIINSQITPLIFNQLLDV